MSTPLVSVVIPTFNGGRLLLQTLQTVFAQTFRDYEIVIVDDGSTDDTLDLLAPLANRLRIFSQPNAGIGAARNRGIDLSCGKYVAMLDHDDLWIPGKLAAQVEFMQRNSGCAACGVLFASTSAPERPLFDPQAIVDEAGIVRKPLTRLASGMNFLTTSALMFDRCRAARARYATKPGAIEDVPFHLQLLSCGPFGIASRQILALHRTHAGSFSRRASYYDTGQRLLRTMHRRGAFAELAAAESEALEAYLAMLGRQAAVRQLMGGHRWRGLRLYLAEFPHQLRYRRWRFLAAYPMAAAAPVGWICRLWCVEQSRFV